MKKNIKIFSPVNGEIKELNKISDPVFADKMLGDGFYIEPSSTIFYSPFEEGNVELVFETKHALFLKSKDGVVGLLHIGLDTVSLKGEPFKVNVQAGDSINLKTKLVNVDLDQIKKANLKISTPLVFDEKQNENWKIKNIKYGKVKAGDLVAEMEYEPSQATSDIEKQTQINSAPVNSIENVAQIIYDNVGGKANFNDVMNCMTRLRISVIDKSIINETNIKNDKKVKNIVWSGNQMQVVIGTDVFKVKKAFDEIIEKDTVSTSKQSNLVKKVAWYKKIIPGISAIIMPALPILMAVGIIAGLQAILVASKVIQMPGKGVGVETLPLLDGLFYILSKVGLNLLGVFLLVSVVKLMKGNIMMAMLIGLTMTSRFLFAPGWSGWSLFNLGDNEILVKGYEGTILPAIIAGFVYIYFDRWVQKWMPSAVDLVFRHALSYIFVMIVVFFLVGPLFAFVEKGLTIAVEAIGKIPFGIGVGLFALLWQPLVLTGSHAALAIGMTSAINAGTPSLLYPAIALGVFGQVGAAIGMAIKTKDVQIQKIVIGSTAAGFFGITEPIIYGATLQKFKPFFLGTIGAFVAGLVSGNLGLYKVAPGGMGLLGFLTLGDGHPGAEATITKIGLGYMTMFISIGGAALLTFLFWGDRVNENRGFKKSVNLVTLIYAQHMNISRKEAKAIVKNKFENLGSEIKNSEKTLKQFSNYVIKENRLITKIETLKTKKEDYLVKYQKANLKLTTWFESKNESLLDQEKLKNLNATKILKQEKIEKHFNLTKFDLKIEHLTTQLNELKASNKDAENFVIDLQLKIETDVAKVLADLAKEIKLEKLNTLNAKFFNAIHSIDIAYVQTPKQAINWTKQDTFKTKNKYLAMFRF
ncbi:glucose PTS transporter subunit IIA [Williamsoniiplasma luminosum]|uniref:PTS system, beta-glucoside-specific IIABC component n=1 Tax=Williamsoniiplasma luminosum TaxID=214888 RepID=A0A2S0NK41_9MOLU|nr:glucose PTS transporter subunit IIA [Williamsoniiplasma luminosum]AVP49378.1 MAG: hypothetical protein C5T88_02150 [Williamsoniiplasma luminosum]